MDHSPENKSTNDQIFFSFIFHQSSVRTITFLFFLMRIVYEMQYERSKILDEAAIQII